MTATLHDTTLETRAKTALSNLILSVTAIRTEWLAYGSALNEMRAAHNGDTEFGKAVAAAGLDLWPSEPLSHRGTPEIKRDVRSAAMWAATLTDEELVTHEAAYPQIDVTVRGGFRGLHAAVLKAAKPKAESAEQDEHESDEPQAEQGATESEKAYTEADVRAAYERGKREGAGQAGAVTAIDTSALSAAQQQKLEAAKRHMQKLFDKKLEQTIAECRDAVLVEAQKLCLKLLPNYEASIARAEEITRSHRGIMTKAQYNIVVACLHPDSRLSVSDEKLAEAFRIMRGAEVPMLPGDVSGTPSAAKMPRNTEEMLKRRDAMKAAKMAAKAAA